jgi:hypothetical protein
MLFTNEIKLRLLELYKTNKQKLEPTSHDAKANATSNNAWADLTATLKHEYPELNVVVKQVKDCYKNMKKNGKEEIVSKKRLAFK